MKALLYVVGLLTAAFAFVGLSGIGDSAIRQNVVLSAWAAALVALGAGAICSAIDAAREKGTEEREVLRKLLIEIRDNTKAPPPPGPEPAPFDAAEAVAKMEAARPIRRFDLNA